MFVLVASFPKYARDWSVTSRLLCMIKQHPQTQPGFTVWLSGGYETPKSKHTVLSLQTLHTEYRSFLVFPATERDVIIKSFSLNTGSRQPPKSLSQHQRSWGWSTTSPSTESQNYTFDPDFFYPSGLASPKCLIKATSQQSWPTTALT